MKIRIKKDELSKDIVGYENYSLEGGGPTYILGTVTEINIEDVSCFHIDEIESRFQSFYEALTVLDGKIIIQGINPRTVLKEFNSYNLDINRLNSILYRPSIKGIYTINYIEDVLKKSGFKVIEKYFEELFSYCIIGIKNGK